MPETLHIARKLAALRGLGFERTDRSSVTTDAVRVSRHSYKVTQYRAAMGTGVFVSVHARSQQRAEEAIGRAFDEMERLIGIFSRYEPASAISSLNDVGRVRGAPPEFLDVVSRSRQLYQWSRGAFDISVAPVLDLLDDRRAVVPRGEPSAAEIRDALALVGVADIDVRGQQIAFKKADMAITLDGIAKGFIVDAIASVLRRHRIKNYLVNAGGDIRASGTTVGKRPWTVAVQNPAKDGTFPDTIRISRGAVATSGNYEIYFDRDRLLHHIVRSADGRSPRECASVSVVAPSTVLADALSTTVFVMGTREGVRFVERLDGCECLIIDRDGHQVRSAGWTGATRYNEEQADA